MYVINVERDATLVVLEGRGRIFEETSKGRKKLTEERGFMGRRSKSQVFGLCSRESDNVMDLVAP